MSKSTLIWSSLMTALVASLACLWAVTWMDMGWSAASYFVGICGVLCPIGALIYTTRKERCQ